MSYHEDEALMIKTIRWTIKACEAISRVGGCPSVLDKFSDESLTLMIRNGLKITPSN